jgi:DNA-binding XRE family transcriptional regulator
MTTLQQHKATLMKNPNFAHEYQAIQPEYELVRQILQYRQQNSITQQQLATQIGIARSNITRLESGNYNPSLNFLKRVATGMGKQLHIKFC